MSGDFKRPVTGRSVTKTSAIRPSASAFSNSLYGTGSMVRAALGYAARIEKLTEWQQSMLQRKAYNKVVVAMAHRTARRIWAVLAKGCAYDPNYPQRAAATAL
jgi:hypothetical protein